MDSAEAESQRAFPIAYLQSKSVGAKMNLGFELTYITMIERCHFLVGVYQLRKLPEMTLDLAMLHGCDAAVFDSLAGRARIVLHVQALQLHGTSAWIGNLHCFGMYRSLYSTDKVSDVDFAAEENKGNAMLRCGNCI